jgi:hypothetical protein
MLHVTCFYFLKTVVSEVKRKLKKNFDTLQKQVSFYFKDVDVSKFE